jgi:hypothetical protein
MDARSRLAARRDTRSILMHPFFKTVNWEAVLQKRVTPPVKPPSLAHTLLTHSTFWFRLNPAATYSDT